MACMTKDNAYEEVLEILLKDGSDGFRAAIETLVNESMKLARERHLKAEPYERNAERTGYSNGFKPKQLKTTLGELSLQIPQVRDSSFYPISQEKGCRVDRTLLLSLAEMYVQGTSTRRVSRIVEAMCGLEVSSMEVSRATEKLDEQFSAWRNRAIGEICYLFFDARYEKVRHGGSVIDCAVLIASGVDSQGKRKLLGVSVSLSEAEVHWRKFMMDLVQRDLHGVKLITSDAHAGLKAARKAVFPSVPWQRCQFHLQQNAQAYVPKQSMKEGVAAKIRAMFNAENRVESERLLTLAAQHYQSTAPKLSEWLEENVSESLTVFEFPMSHRKKIRTSNVLERVNKEVKRRTRVAGLFPNEASCERLVTAVLMEISEGWETGKTYISFAEKRPD